ncbi:MAG TPA: glycosyltransferase family 39 protein [Rhizomicrobium sp.]|nr:glycosyltransferase family 39 protein [Rhizomicrobium sp.]
MRGKALSLAGLAVVLLLAWLPALVTLPPLDRDESRFAEASRQMVETGNYVDIRFASGPRYNKPIGIYWLQSLASIIAGPGSRAAIQVYRVPSLVGGVLSAILLWLCARGIASREAALVSALFLGTTFLLTTESVIATTDACLLATVIGAQSVLLRIYLAERQQRSAPRTGFVMAGWLAVGVGILLKGPVIVAVLGVTIVALSIWDRDFAWLRATKAFRGALLALALVLPWAVAIGFASHGAFYEQSLGQDFAAKVMGGRESHGAPPGYYLLETIIAFWPATLVLVPALARAIVRRRDPLVRFLLVWAVAVWLLFELVPTKLPHYVLPAYPAFALLCGLWVVQDLDRNEGRFSGTFRIASAVLFIVGAAVAAAACLYAPLRFGGSLSAPLLAGAAVAASLACVAVFSFLRNRVLPAAGLAIASAVAFDLVLGLTVVPELHDLWLSPRAAALVAANRRSGDGPPVVTGYVEPSLVFLLGPNTRIAPARAAAAQAHGLALVESRAVPDFLGGAASSGLVAKSLGQVRGLDYSIGRHEVITLYRLMPAAR